MPTNSTSEKPRRPPLKDVPIPEDILRLGDAKMRTGDETVLHFYLRVIAGGASPRMAEALALQQSPGIGITDTIFLADQNRHGRTILDRMGGNDLAVEQLRKDLAKRGYRLGPHDHYIPTAARFHADPEAVVNHTQTLGDLKKRIAARGTEVHGVIEREAFVTKRPKRIRLHPDLVREIDRKNLAANPDLVTTPVAERHEAIIEKHGGRKIDND